MTMFEFLSSNRVKYMDESLREIRRNPLSYKTRGLKPQKSPDIFHGFDGEVKASRKRSRVETSFLRLPRLRPQKNRSGLFQY